MCTPPPNLPKAGEEMENFTSLFCSTEIEKAPAARGLRRQVVGERQQFYMLSPSVRFAASSLPEGAFFIILRQFSKKILQMLWQTPA